ASSLLGEASSLLGEASSLLGEASSLLGEASSLLGEASSLLGEASSLLGEASSLLGEAWRYGRFWKGFRWMRQRWTIIMGKCSRYLWELQVFWGGRVVYRKKRILLVFWVSAKVRGLGLNTESGKNVDCT